MIIELDSKRTAYASAEDKGVESYQGGVLPLWHDADFRKRVKMMNGPIGTIGSIVEIEVQILCVSGSKTSVSVDVDAMFSPYAAGDLLREKLLDAADEATIIAHNDYSLVKFTGSRHYYKLGMSYYIDGTVQEHISNADNTIKWMQGPNGSWGNFPVSNPSAWYGTYTRLKNVRMVSEARAALLRMMNDDLKPDEFKSYEQTRRDLGFCDRVADAERIQQMLKAINR